MVTSLPDPLRFATIRHKEVVNVGNFHSSHLKRHNAIAASWAYIEAVLQCTQVCPFLARSVPVVVYVDICITRFTIGVAYSQPSLIICMMLPVVEGLEGATMQHVALLPELLPP